MWTTISAPPDAQPPTPLTVRAQSIPSRARFPRHAHDWGQVVYAISGVLTVAIDNRAMVISPERAVWLPPATSHRVGSLLGAEFRSLWIAADASGCISPEPIVFEVSPLLKALIVEAASLEDDEDEIYSGRVTQLILDQLRRARALPGSLPWPTSDALNRMCEALYDDPADARSAVDWSSTLNMSPRTLTRRFEAEVGMSLRSWRRRMRLFKAIEMLGDGDVTQTGLKLGYGSTSAFIFAFRREFGTSPSAFMRAKTVSHDAAAIG